MGAAVHRAQHRVQADGGSGNQQPGPTRRAGTRCDQASLGQHGGHPADHHRIGGDGGGELSAGHRRFRTIRMFMRQIGQGVRGDRKALAIGHAATLGPLSAAVHRLAAENARAKHLAPLGGVTCRGEGPD